MQSFTLLNHLIVMGMIEERYKMHKYNTYFEEKSKIEKGRVFLYEEAFKMFSLYPKKITLDPKQALATSIRHNRF